MVNNISSNLFDYELAVDAPAKINLHLEILGLRNDGFHELAMTMQSIDLSDKLLFKKNTSGEINLVCNDQSLSTNQDNLVTRAASLIRNRLGNEELGVSIYLEKKIPIGAGLAGGSSDAAATLLGLNSLWGINSPEKQLIELSSELGSDVPFCIGGGTQFCFGRGEKLEVIKQQNSAMAVLLVKDPLVSISTPWAYKRFRELKGKEYLTTNEEFEICRQKLRDAKWLNPISPDMPPPLRNDLQEIVAPETSSVKTSLELLSAMPGALSIAMSGSGPSCFALYASIDEAKFALEQNGSQLKDFGLNAWCCSFNTRGVSIIHD